jgi:signal transduction histidine kinase/ligand-binding sensor domain-containing protein
MKNRHTIILFFMQAFSILSFSQTGNPKFIHLTTVDGLSQGKINAILKDHEGFMWFATNEGLNKYDGYTFTAYKRDEENPASISNNIVYDVAEYDAENLWVATGTGLDKFNRYKNEFIHYKPDKGVVKNIFQDSRKRIWVATSDGLYVLNQANGTFQGYHHISGDSNSLSDNEVYNITGDDFGDLWIATKNGLNRFNPLSQRFYCYKNDPRNCSSIAADWIRTVYKDSKGNIWAGTLGSGIALYERSKNSFINYRHDIHNSNSLCLNDILSFGEDGKGNLWIGTENGGISVFDHAANTFVTYKNDPYDANSLNNNSIYSIYKDDLNGMWVGTYSEGVNYLSQYKNKFVHYNQSLTNRNGLNDHNILSIAGSGDDYIWIGTDGGGLNRFDKKTKTFTHYLNSETDKNSINSNVVISVIAVDKDLLALGLLKGGLDLFNTKTGRFTHHLPEKDKPTSISLSAAVNILCRSLDGNIWAGTWGGGLNFYDRKKDRFAHYENDHADTNTISSNFTTCLFEDSKGNLWAGSSEGLDRLDKSTGKFIHYRHSDKNKKSLSQSYVQYIFEDHAHNLWVGTSAGLNLFNPKNQTFTAYTEKDGLANDMILSIEEDHNGNLWLGSNNGLTKFNPISKAILNYDISDGLQGKQFKPNSCFQAANGEMFFGGTNGFNTFYPDSLKDNQFIPPVYITGFQIFNKEVMPGGKASPIQQAISEAKEITLSYKQSVFSFEFAALNFTKPGENEYSYKLEGFDKDWNYAGHNRTATYTNLDPATYVFKVKGSNNDGVWNEKGASIKIVITPPYWLTWWFRLGIILLVIGTGISFYWFRISIIKKQNLLLEQKVNQQTIELVHVNKEERAARIQAESARAESEIAKEDANQANQKLKAINKELEQFAYVASHDLQEPLRMVTSYLTQLDRKYRDVFDEKGKQYIHFAVDGATRMRQIILDLLEYSRIGITEGNRENIDLNVLVNDIVILHQMEIKEKNAVIHYSSLPVVNGYKVLLRQVFQNLIGNALKYSCKNRDTKIEITATELSNCWEFAVIDNGIGIDKQYFDKVFILFQRLHNKDEFSGTGIGLAVTKKIIENMGGRIWVESREGEGSTFFFTLTKQITG